MSSSASASSSKSKKRVGPDNDFKVGKQLKVHIVDDDDVSQTTHILFLQKCGVETLGVRNGNVAVNIHDITQMRFDLIFMNSVLPLMDGIQVSFLKSQDYFRKHPSPHGLAELVGWVVSHKGDL